MSKGVILCGGTGSRLYPISLVINKHLLPVYNKPMVYHPIEFLRDSGITDLLIILGGNSVGEMVNLLKDGEELGVSITYKLQSKAGGIADALSLARDFVGDEDFVVMLGDNIIDGAMPNILNKFNSNRDSTVPTGMVFLSPTQRPSSFGVPTFNSDMTGIIKITEKPSAPDTNFAVIGLYIYDKSIWGMIDSLKPSNRSEKEITDVNNFFINHGVLKYEIINSSWSDAGTIDSLFEASNIIKKRDIDAAKK